MPIYDPLAKLLGADRFCNKVIQRMRLGPGLHFLDIGCGTGTLAVLVKQLHPSVSVFGLDPDRRALARAARKAERAGVEAYFDLGFSDQLPYADASFDRVYCNIFSLLRHKEKELTLGEVRRVLRPGGLLHLDDMEKAPPGFAFWRLFKSTQGYEFCTENQMIALMHDAGFTEPKKISQEMMWIWTFASYQAIR